MSRPRIAVVICTSRKPRANPQIANFVMDTIKATYSKTSELQSSLSMIDLAEKNLPFCDEPDIPSQVHDYTKYVHAHTRQWSQEVQSYDGFIFVTPQYNWGYPAVLKNAIDYLYNEWKGKVAMVVSYGGHGGGKSNGQLRQVLCGVKITPTKKNVELTFPSKGFTAQAAHGEQLDLDGSREDGVWSEQRLEIAESFAELMELVAMRRGVSADATNGGP